MVCLEIFINHCNQNLEIVRMSWEHHTGTKFDDIEPIIRNKLVFEPKNHKGLIEPMYYFWGIPSLIWVCRLCKQTT